MPCGRGPCLQQRKAQANEIDVVSCEVHYCCLLCNRPCGRGPCLQQRKAQANEIDVVSCEVHFSACCVGEGHAFNARAQVNEFQDVSYKMNSGCQLCCRGDFPAKHR
jgi:hypothetical protein